MKKTLLLLLLALPLLLAACQTPSTPATDATDSNAVVDSHTAENALDWPGRYAGLLPCADCEGIQTQLTLNADKTYVLEEHYVKNGRAFTQAKPQAAFSLMPRNPRSYA